MLGYADEKPAETEPTLAQDFENGLLAAPILGTVAAPNLGTTPDAKRWSRRLHVGNLPAGDDCTEANIMKFFIAAMKRMGLSSGDCVTEVFVAENATPRYCFLQFKTPEEATRALANLDGIEFLSSKLTLQRPRELPAPATPAPAPGMFATMQAQQQMQLQQLQLRALQLQGLSGGAGTMHAQLLMQQQLAMQRMPIAPGMGGIGMAPLGLAAAGMSAGLAATPAPTMPAPLAPAPPPPGQQQEDLQAAIKAAMAVSTSKEDGSTKIVCISNLLSDAEMADQQESQDVLEDTKDKCEDDFGPVSSAILVLPSDGDFQGWTGRLLVHFNDVEHAKKAAEKLHGLKFDGRPVACSFVDEKTYGDLKGKVKLVV